MTSRAGSGEKLHDQRNLNFDPMSWHVFYGIANKTSRNLKCLCISDGMWDLQSVRATSLYGL